MTYDPAKTLARFHNRWATKITLLSDRGSAVIRALGLLNKDHSPGSFAYGVSHPIILVLNRQGVLTHRFSDADYSVRPSANSVLRALGTSP